LSAGLELETTTEHDDDCPVQRRAQRVRWNGQLGGSTTRLEEQMRTFSERLKAAMAAHKLSQRDLAARMDVDESLISHYVNGNREPGRKLMADILDALPNADARQLIGCRK
jgi:ribosome-binding protein aMBF1 (putative translation factor)